MRLRNVTGAIDTINDHPLVNHKPEEYRGRWNEFFGNSNPIRVEIGMGKGDFIIENAKRNPKINFIGIEKFSGVLLRAVWKLEREEASIDNLCLIRFDAVGLLDVFGKSEIDMIYLNFSDPWPKERKAKHRLTHRKFLDMYHIILGDKGRLQFKSDNNALYQFSLEEVKVSNFDIRKQSTDLYQSEYLEANIMTEYESKFVAEGKKINYLYLQKKS